MKPQSEAYGLENSILHLLHRAGQQAEIMFMKEVNDNTMTPRQYAVLFSVNQNEDISQTGLVAQTGIDRSTLADVVRRLVEKGMLQRKRTRNDARKYAVRLTPNGREALEASHPAAIRADDTILATVPSRQRGEFLAILSTIVKTMDGLSEAA